MRSKGFWIDFSFVQVQSTGLPRPAFTTICDSGAHTVCQGRGQAMGMAQEVSDFQGGRMTRLSMSLSRSGMNTAKTWNLSAGALSISAI